MTLRFILISLLLLAVNKSVLSAEYNASITTHLGNNKTFHAGDKFSLLISLSETSSALIIYETAENDLIQIFPNYNLSETLLPSGEYYPLTWNKDVMWFTVSAPFGTERIWLFTATKPFPNLNDFSQKVGVYYRLKLSLEQLKQKLNRHFIGAEINLHVVHAQINTAP